MRAKEFLSKYLDYENSVGSKKRRILEQRERAVSLSQALSEKVQRSHSIAGKLYEIDNYLDGESELEAQIVEIRAEQAKIAKIISAVKDEIQKEVLIKRYIKSQRWSEIAEKMNYEERQIYRIHGKALTAVEDILTILGHVLSV